MFAGCRHEFNERRRGDAEGRAEPPATAERVTSLVTLAAAGLRTIVQSGAARVGDGAPVHASGVVGHSPPRSLDVRVRVAGLLDLDDLYPRVVLHGRRDAGCITWVPGGSLVHYSYPYG